MTKNEEKSYFLDDEPKTNLEAEDAFGHRFYSHTLLEILDKTTKPNSYAIGLFGKWGVGKTSIINELERLIQTKRKSHNSRKYELIKIDTWEYSEQNFRREFLLDIAHHFDCYESINEELSSSMKLEDTLPPKLTLSTLWSILRQIFIFLAAWLLYFIAITKLTELFSLNADSATISLILGLATTLTTVSSDNLKKILTFRPIIKETSPAVHADQFRELFQKIIYKHAKIEKSKRILVFILDNLDRVSEEIVVEILSSVKTFLREDNCVFILPCDDKGLRQHIIDSRSSGQHSPLMTESEANEYLRKFFQTTITIRDILDEDIISFTENILSRMRILDEPSNTSEDQSIADRKEIIQKNNNELGLVLRVAIAKNPRRIIQLCNKVTANYLHARQRGKNEPNLFSHISSNLGFLAKISIIEEEWR